MRTEHVIKKSKRLSWLLRHGAREADVAMDPAGWVAIADALRVCRLTREELEIVVARNDKRRLQLDGERIRACQGHSPAGTPVTLDALESTWRRYEGELAYHATNLSALDGIVAAGLRPMRRTHVHLAATVDSKVGKRARTQVALVVSVDAARKGGLEVFEAPNGVVLVRHVPREAIVDVIGLSRRGREAVPIWRARFGG